MKPTQQDLYTSILYRAADIYGVEVDDVEKDIGQNFDPVVRFMAGAMASELEKVYEHLDRTEGRLQERLAQVLLPEYYHLPQPAHALATAQPLGDNLIIDHNVLFQTDIEHSTEPPVHFTPVFPSLLLPAEIKVVATDNEVIDLSNRGRGRGMEKSAPKEVQRITLGFESPDAIENWQGASLYFNLVGRGALESERTLFYTALGNAQYVHNGNLISFIKGLGHNDLELEDYLNGNERLESNLRARYNHMFVTFTDAAVEEAKPVDLKSYLSNWLQEATTENDELQKRIDAVANQHEKPLYWLEIHLSKPIEVSDIASRLRVAFNVFPVVNRGLNGHKEGEHHFLKNNAIKWIPLEPKDDFLAIKSVYEEKSPNHVHYVFKAFSDFKQEKRPSYTTRHGGIGRWDEFNAWKRLSYIVEVLQENYKYEELVDAAASSLSLEEVHQFLGNKIAATNDEEKPTKNIYVLLHSGDTSGVRARVEYWTSIGEAANGINSKTSL
ncbi:MAG: type VI secretion system baseplate subunit TssF, partial [Flavobacteriales bacterium]